MTEAEFIEKWLPSPLKNGGMFQSDLSALIEQEKRKPLASVIIKPTCVEAHGGENEAFEAAMKELHKRYILWALGEKPRQFTFEMYVDEYLKQQ